MTKLVDVIDMFWQRFRPGDSVMVITDRDELFWGILEENNHACILTRPFGTTHKIRWSRVRFVALDGFPVREILKLDDKTAQNIFDQTDIPKQRVQILEAIDERRNRSITFGDPFEAEFESIQLHNPSHSQPGYEETIELQSSCGAIGIIYGADCVIEVSS